MASSTVIGFQVSFQYKIGVNSKNEELYNTQTFKDMPTTVSDATVVAFADKVNGFLLEGYDISSMKKNLTYSVSRV